MEMAQYVVTAIATVGFPIVMCILLLLYNYKMSTTNTEQMQAQRDTHNAEVKELMQVQNENISALCAAINQNTVEMQKLVSVIEVRYNN